MREGVVKRLIPAVLFLLALEGVPAAGDAQAPARPKSIPIPDSISTYAWLPDSARIETLAARFPVPEGYRRVPVEKGSFADWLRNLPMKPSGSPVRSYAGDVVLETGDPNLAGVVDLDLLGSDLQQCADAIIRLRAEYLWSKGEQNGIVFHFTNGDPSSWTGWAQGRRPLVDGNSVRWIKTASPDNSRASFVHYLTTLFHYAGTLSLPYDSTEVPIDRILPGDFFVDGGRPGHAVLVLDVATSAEGRRRLLIGQSFMPAQDFHVLRARTAGGWFDADPARPGLDTPGWKTFPWSSLRRFKE
uniref:DUF4846 domain-containing protein n=1 Tax=uncultured Latescibacterota bacterium TaxID=199737 RepID=Q2YZW6_9BACT|nr:hypothetical protein [uncultured Latescibacterota bacterium]